jgi:asparagine synthase (glutamine-hydrolysing)
VVSTWNNPGEMVMGALDSGHEQSFEAGEIFDNPATAAMLLDLITYLPDDVLTKVDRASMAYGLEARVPFLDHRVVEFAWRIPLRWKIRSGKGKWILRRLLTKYLPQAVFERPKTGFGVPIGTWLREGLRDWADDMLSESTLHEHGFFDAKRVHSMWIQHRGGERNWQQHLWCILMFESWLEGQSKTEAVQNLDCSPPFDRGVPLSSSSK